MKYVYCSKKGKVIPAHEQEKEYSNFFIINDKLTPNGDYIQNPLDGLYYSSKSKLRNRAEELGYKCVGNAYEDWKPKKEEKPIDYEKAFETAVRDYNLKIKY
jgi:hypothetical protein